MDELQTPMSTYKEYHTLLNDILSPSGLILLTLKWVT